MENCPLQKNDAAGVLLDYAARRLDADVLRALERHMAVCEQCRAFGEQQRMLWSALDSWDAEPVSLEFQREFWERADRKRAARWWEGIALRPAIAAAVLALVLFSSPPRRMVQEPTPDELAAVEQALEDLDMLSQLQSQVK